MGEPLGLDEKMMYTTLCECTRVQFASSPITHHDLVTVVLCDDIDRSTESYVLKDSSGIDARSS